MFLDDDNDVVEADFVSTDDFAPASDDGDALCDDRLLLMDKEFSVSDWLDGLC